MQFLVLASAATPLSWPAAVAMAMATAVALMASKQTTAALIALVSSDYSVRVLQLLAVWPFVQPLDVVAVAVAAATVAAVAVVVAVAASSTCCCCCL